MSNLLLRKVTEKVAKDKKSKLDILSFPSKEGDTTEYYSIHTPRKQKKEPKEPKPKKSEQLSGKNLQPNYFKKDNAKTKKAPAKPKKRKPARTTVF